ncbi:MAG: phosphosulfolactate synthase [Candidatus Dormibacteria bacterium]
MSLSLFQRPAKPRPRGITMMIDPGLPSAAFADVIESFHPLLDLVKLGWGTALVTPRIDDKTAVLREFGVDFYFGGTLLERYIHEGRVEEFVLLARRHGARHVEVSNGTIPMSQADKCRWIERLAHDFTVISEVGFKSAERSAQMPPAEWVSAAYDDLAAGASLVTTETRESGRSGIATKDGHMRLDALRALLTCVGSDRILFEAPTKELQVELIRAIGPNVNLGNIASADVIGLETLRLGLRADTLLDLAPEAASETSEAPAQRRPHIAVSAA